LGSPKHAFLDFFQVMFDMGPPISRGVQLVSFHTVSKGYWGECGQRGGYFEMTNLPPKVFVIAAFIRMSLVPSTIEKFIGR
jgi:glutamate--glyoxylate aminotransferase